MNDERETIEAPSENDTTAPVDAAPVPQEPVPREPVPQTTDAQPSDEPTNSAAESAPGVSDTPADAAGADVASDSNPESGNGLIELNTQALEQLVAGIGNDLQKQMQALTTLFDQKINREIHLDGIIDRLHADLQEHKQGIHRKILEPIAKDLITMYDDLGAAVQKWQDLADSDEAAKRCAKDLQVTQEEVEDILYRYGFESYSAETDVFDPTCQSASRVDVTHDEHLDGKVAERRRRGFRFDGLPIRPELVVVYRYEPAAETVDGTESPSESESAPEAVQASNEESNGEESTGDPSDASPPQPAG